jgi:hypothetical protein
LLTEFETTDASENVEKYPLAGDPYSSRSDFGEQTDFSVGFVSSDGAVVGLQIKLEGATEYCESTEDIGSIGLPARDGEGLGYSRAHDSSIGI